MTQVVPLGSYPQLGSNMTQVVPLGSYPQLGSNMTQVVPLGSYPQLGSNMTQVVPLGSYSWRRVFGILGPFWGEYLGAWVFWGVSRGLLQISESSNMCKFCASLKDEREGQPRGLHLKGEAAHKGRGRRCVAGGVFDLERI